MVRSIFAIISILFAISAYSNNPIFDASNLKYMIELIRNSEKMVSQLVNIKKKIERVDHNIYNIDNVNLSNTVSGITKQILNNNISNKSYEEKISKDKWNFDFNKKTFSEYNKQQSNQRRILMTDYLRGLNVAEDIKKTISNDNDLMLKIQNVKSTSMLDEIRVQTQLLTILIKYVQYQNHLTAYILSSENTEKLHKLPLHLEG